MEKNEEISIAIGKIINGYGYKLLSPFSHIKGLLMDLLPRYKKEQMLLLTALSCGVGDELYKSKKNDGNVSDKAKKNCKRFLIEAYVSEEAADMVIGWIVASFEVKDSLPKPKHYENDTSPIIQDFEIASSENEPVSHADQIANDSVQHMREIASRFLSSTSRKEKIQEHDNSNIQCDDTGKVLIHGDLTATEYIFDEEITTIGDRAFINANNLVSVTFTNNITNIGKEAFANCIGLTNVVLLRSMQVIGAGVFKGCSSLSNISMPSNMEIIPNSMFKKCSSLLSITIPRSVQIIGDEAFRECTSLKMVNMPATLTSIGNRTFMGCINLHSIIIPSSVKNIGRDAFIGCADDFSVDIIDNIYAIKYCILHHIKYNRINW